jgi:SecD/SecF fusion protein
MKNRLGILVLFVVFSLISVYYLVRTWKVNDIRKEAAAYATGKDGVIDASKKQRYLDSLWKQDVFLGSTLEELSKQELGLGLDLQGGMHVILEVSPTEIIKTLAKGSRDPRVAIAVDAAKKAAVTSSTNFVDLFVAEYRKLAKDTKLASIFSNTSNRDVLNLNSSDAEVIRYVKAEVDGAFDRSYKVIQTRVDKFGVANPNLSKIPGTNRIQVELPGIDNPERVRKLLSGAAKLEFCEVYSLQEINPSMEALSALLTKIDLESKIKTTENKIAAKDTSKSSLASALKTKTDSTGTDSLANANSMANIFVASPTGGLAVRSKDTSRLNAVLKRADAQGIFPANLSFMYDVSPVENPTTKEEVVPVYAVKDHGNAPIEGDVITNAKQDYDPMTGKPDVTMQMNALGARKWKSMTGANVGKSIAIILDNYVYSAPNVNQEISGGSSSISGGFSIEQAQDLANVLKAGKLPAPTNIIEEATVGASVGAKAVSAGVLSSILGLVAVLIFVMVYYSKAGWIANAALLVNLVLLLGVMASFGATMTLPGIAGLVLSVGMSVDANVLIYERIKEELAAGKSFITAVGDGFKNAMPSIIDSNVTNLITAVILMIFGTGLVKGFATTLLIGIFTSLFCAVFVSRLLFDYNIKKGKTINFKTAWTEKLFKDSNIDFIKKRKVFYIISAAIILAGAVSIGIRGFGLGVDFKGGRTFVVKFEKTVNTEEVRAVVEGVFPGSNAEVKTYGGFDQVMVTSAYKIDNTEPEVEKQISADLNKAVASVNGNKGKVMSFSKVGATIANDTIWSSLKAILYALILTFIYIYIRFRSVAFGFGAVVALFHDVLVILGIFSILNGILPFSLDIDQAFVGAVLTLMGYSMSDTVVIFDRIREYLREKGSNKEPIETTINNALNSTLSRTAVTGVATLLVLLILLIFGGETIRGFIFAMFIGVIVGTYSSLFIAAPIVVDAMQRRLEKDGDAMKVVPAVDVKK